MFRTRDHKLSANSGRSLRRTNVAATPAYYQIAGWQKLVKSEQ